MAVITPIHSNYAELDAAPVSRPHALAARRPARAGCAAALVLADVAAFPLSFGAAALLAWLGGMAVSGMELPAAQLHVAMLRDAVLMAGVVLYFARQAHYARRLPFWSVLRDVVTASVVALLCDGFLEFSMQRLESRLLIGLTWTLFPLAVMLTRRLARLVLARAGLWELRTVVIGQGQHARQAATALLSESALGYAVAGIVNPSLHAVARGSLWHGILRQHRAELLVLALDTQAPATAAITQSLVRERVPFAVMPRLDGLPVLGFEQTSFFSHDTVMFTFRNNLAQPVPRAIKLAFDFAAALVMLVIAAPALLAIAAAIKLDGGPVFYAHRRVGARGREFGCLKFRSMVTDADAVLRRVLAHDPEAAAEWEDAQKLRDDPRVTRIGRFLRKTSLDELPQLLNVLRLEMSLVGPRPIVRAEVPRYGDDIAFYYETRPGVTGLWQVSGRSDTGYDQRVQLDTWYVKNWTLWHDLAILAKTVPAVLQRRGAI